MRLLPKLVRGTESVWLPLCDATAELLSQALLAERTPAREQLWLEAVAEDPSLTLWCLCRAADLESPRRVADVASWLSRHALRELRWTGQESAAAGSIAADEPAVDEAARARFAEWAACGVGVARLARAFASQNAELDAETAYLLGLIHAAPQWLGVASPGACASDFLPGWLSAELASLARAKTSNRAVSLTSVVKHAQDALEPKGRRKGMISPELASLGDCRAAIQERWLAASSGSAALPLLVERLSRLEQLETDFARTLEAEKIESLKGLAYGAGHEINNPLANISARAQTLLMEEHDPERRRKLAAINTQAFRAHEMIADMMLFARPPQLKRARVDLSQLVGSLLEDLREQATAQDTLVEFHDAVDAMIAWADTVQLSVAIRALCTNSFEALGHGGRVEVALQLAEATDAGERSSEYVQIVVSDNGPGIAPETRRHLFDPFYSGREAGRGLGFGLSKCWRIVSDHGGRIDVNVSPAGGARLSLSIPRFAESGRLLSETAH